MSERPIHFHFRGAIRQLDGAGVAHFGTVERPWVELVADGVLRDATRPVGDIEILDGYEREAVLLVGRGAQVHFDEQHLADAVQAQIAANPDAAALAFEGRTVSYAEFGARVAVFARELIAAGIGPDDPVAVCLSRSVEMVVALHAVIAAGGQYVPIDPDAPAERVESMLDTVGARVLAVRAGDEQTSAAGLAATRGLTVAVVDCSTPADLTAQPVTQAERVRLVELERENRELRAKAEFLGKAAAFFAQEYR